MDLLSLAGNLASLVGLLITVFTLVEVVRTKSWAKQKLARTNERWRCVRLADRIAATRHMIRQMTGMPVRRQEGSWRSELRERLSAMSNDQSFSVLDKAIIKKAIRGFHIPVKDADDEAGRLSELLIDLAGLESRISAKIGPEDEE